MYVYYLGKPKRLLTDSQIIRNRCSQRVAVRIVKPKFLAFARSEVLWCRRGQYFHVRKDDWSPSRSGTVKLSSPYVYIPVMLLKSTPILYLSYKKRWPSFGGDVRLELYGKDHLTFSIATMSSTLLKTDVIICPGHHDPGTCYVYEPAFDQKTRDSFLSRAQSTQSCIYCVATVFQKKMKLLTLHNLNLLFFLFFLF